MDSRQKLKDLILEAYKLAARVESYSNDEAKSVTIGLPSPRDTPALEDERVKEELKKNLDAKYKEIIDTGKTLQQEELTRISSCSSDAYDDILGVRQDEKEQDKDCIRTENWVLLGCLLHPNADENFKGAFEKLHSAAKKTEIDDVYIELVNNRDINTMIPMNEVAAGIKIQEEIKRILACADDKYDDILGVDPGIEDHIKSENRESNWINKGCELHPKNCHFKQADKAFLKLQNAAYKIEVDDAKISAVKDWDGKEDINMSEEEENDDDDERHVSDMEFDIPEPSPKTNMLYQKATVLMRQLIVQPSNPTALGLLSHINVQLGDDAKDHHIQYTTFQQHYKIVLEAYETLFSHSEGQIPENDNNLPPPDEEQPKVILERAKHDIPRARAIIDQLITQRHYPMDWSIPDAEYYRNLLSSETESTLMQKSETELSQNPLSPVTEFPNYGKDWLTLQYNDRSRIIGWRPVGGFGKQVCIERKENGRLIRRLAAASTCGAGLDVVDEYSITKGSKKLSEGQNNWSKKDRTDFIQLHWVTQSVTNSSSNDPATYCCVEFSKKGIQILTASNFRNVVTPDKANIEIAKVCERDGINVPWKRGCLADIGYSPAKVKDPEERFAAVDRASWNQDSRIQRRALKDKTKGKTPSGEDLTAQSSTTNELAIINDRVTSLESIMQMLQKTLAALEQVSVVMGQHAEMNGKILDRLDKLETRARDK